MSSKDIYSSDVQKKQSSKKPKKQKHQRSKGKRIGAFIGKAVVCLFLICIITGSIVVTALTVYVMKATETDSTISLAKEDIQTAGITTIMAPDPANPDGEIEVSKLSTGTKRIWVDIQDCPEDLKNAFIAIEDKRFYEHEGVDFKRTFLAFANMILHFWDTEQGGSTITQQLVKNITNDNAHSAGRKVREIFNAMSLERTYSKDEILQAYLNIITIGGKNGDYEGVGAAAKLYFNKDVSELTLPECASIAAITRSPSTYEPIHNPEKNKERRDWILKNMYDQGLIEEADYQNAIATPVEVNQGQVTGNMDGSNYQSYFVDAVINEVRNDLMEEYGYDKETAEAKIKTSGYIIHTTMDVNAQKKLEQHYQESSTFANYDIIKESTDRAENGGNPFQSAMVLYDYNGAMKAVVGGIGEKPPGDRSVINRAVQGQRSPGSAIKPLSIYSLAIEEDLCHYSSIMQDEPISIEQPDGTMWEPQNFGGKSYGSVTIQKAVEMSLNRIPIKLDQTLTPKKSYDFLTKSLGFTDLTESADANLAPMSLGSLSNGVHLDELTNAYQIFGNGGYFTESHTYTSVTNAAGDEVLKKDLSTNQVISEDTATIMNRLLRQVVVGSSGTARAIGDINGIEILGKTGTTNDDFDSTFVGLTPDYIAGIWFGYEQNYDITKNKGLKKQVAAWKTIMSDILSDSQNKSFQLSSDVVEATYCTETGMIATSGCPSTATGYYKKDNKPGTCSVHG